MTSLRINVRVPPVHSTRRDLPLFPLHPFPGPFFQFCTQQLPQFCSHLSPILSYYTSPAPLSIHSLPFLGQGVWLGCSMFKKTHQPPLTPTTASVHQFFNSFTAVLPVLVLSFPFSGVTFSTPSFPFFFPSLASCFPFQTLPSFSTSNAS